MRVVLPPARGLQVRGHPCCRPARVTLPTWAPASSVLGPVTLEAVLARRRRRAASGRASSAASARPTRWPTPIGAARAARRPVRARLSRRRRVQRRAAARREHPAGAPGPRLCGASRSRPARAARGILMPVLEDALDRSLLLAAAMDSRGYGRRARPRRGPGGSPRALILAGLLGACVGRLRAARRHRSRPPRACPLLAAGPRPCVPGCGWAAGA